MDSWKIKKIKTERKESIWPWREKTHASSPSTGGKTHENTGWNGADGPNTLEDENMLNTYLGNSLMIINDSEENKNLTDNRL